MENDDISERGTYQYLVAESYRLAGRMDDARSATDTLKQILEADESALPIQFAILHASNGERDKAYVYLEEALRDTTISPLVIARAYLELGEIDQAFVWLEKAYDARIIWLVRIRNYVEVGVWSFWIGTHRIWEPLNDDPRYHALIKKIGLIG
jgi:tetratricopeptide (TPR) repeat protein